MAQTIQSGCGGQPAIFIRGLVIFLDARNCWTETQPVGLGGAAGMPPKEAQVPMAITAKASLANSSTLCAMETGLPLRSPTAP
jgi:hypothetical protein